jgi:hypothetical protein
MRRAVSTAYYALFHKVLAAGASRFMGAGTEHSPGYSILYRSFAHGRIKTVCEALDVASLGRNLARQLGRNSVSADMREFASHFVSLQNARHTADYDPGAEFARSDVERLLDAAEIAIAAFDRCNPDEQADVLALMLSNPRA